MTFFVPRVSKFLIENGYSVEYPDGKTFALCLTHDIDHVYRSGAKKGAVGIEGIETSRLPRNIPLHLPDAVKKFPLCNFSEIMSLEEKFDARSTFFMAESPGDLAFTYEIERPGA